MSSKTNQPQTIRLHSLNFGTKSLNKVNTIEEDELYAIEPETCCSKCIISHNNNYRQIWDILIAILLIYLALCLPFLFAFVPKPGISFTYWDWFVDGCFIIDIPLNFITTYEDIEGNIIDEPSQIISNY